MSHRDSRAGESSISNIDSLSFEKKDNTATSRPDVFAYSNTVDLLNDWLTFLKNREPRLSLTRFAKRAGVSPSYLSMILAGERRLTYRSLNKISDFLKMKKEELDFVHVLLKIETSTTTEEKDQAFKSAQQIEAYKNNNVEETATYGYLSNWLNIAIHKLVQQDDFSPNYKWIQARLSHKASKKQIEESLDFLIESELVRKSDSGRYSTSVINIKCEDQVFKMALIMYHKQMLKLAASSLETMSGRENRYVVGSTVSVSQDQYVEICKIIEEAKKKIHSVESRNTENRSRVIQIELSAFSLAERDGKRGKNG